MGGLWNRLSPKTLCQEIGGVEVPDFRIGSGTGTACGMQEDREEG